MSALLYLLTLTLCCCLKNGYCISFEEFKADPRAMSLIEQFNNKQIKKVQELLKALKKIKLEISLATLYGYLNRLKEEKNDGGSRLRSQINSTTETENFLSRAYQNLLIRQHLEIIKSVPGSVCKPYRSLSGASQQAAPQFPALTLPASMHDTQLSEASSYYPFNQLTPLNSSTDFVPFQAETHFSNLFGGDLHNGDGTLESVVNTRKPSSSKSASKGSPSYYRDAVPYQQAPMPDTSLSEFPHHPSNQSAPLNSSTDFVPSQAETEMHPWDWPCGDLYNDVGTLESMFKPKNP